MMMSGFRDAVDMRYSLGRRARIHEVTAAGPLSQTSIGTLGKVNSYASPREPPRSRCSYQSIQTFQSSPFGSPLARVPGKFLAQSGAVADHNGKSASQSLSASCTAAISARISYQKFRETYSGPVSVGRAF